MLLLPCTDSSQAVKQDMSAWNPASPWTYKYVTEKRLAKHEEDAVIRINPDHPKYFVVRTS